MANVVTSYNDQYGYNSLNGSSDENVQVVGVHSTFPSGSSGQYVEPHLIFLPELYTRCQNNLITRSGGKI